MAIEGTYISEDDLYRVFGRQTIETWAEIEPDGFSADWPDRIEQAIVDAEQQVEARFRRSVYAVPFEGDGMPIIKRWMATLAGVMLASAREIEDDNDHLPKLRERVEFEIRRVLAGSVQLFIDRAVHGQHAPEVVENE